MKRGSKDKFVKNIPDFLPQSCKRCWQNKKKTFFKLYDKAIVKKYPDVPDFQRTGQK